MLHDTKKRRRQKHKPPSRIKYEEANPTVNFRVGRKNHEKLHELLRVSGKSIGDFFRQALRVQKISAGKAYNTGYNDGCRDGRGWGYKEASDHYRVTYPCSICEQNIELTTE